MIYIDTSVFYHYTTNGEFADMAEKVLTSPEPKITSDLVLDEFLFVIIRREVQREFGIRSLSTIKGRLSKSPELVEFIYETGKRALAVFEAFDVMVVPDSRDWAKTLLFMRHYHLFPHDARIIATAWEYGTKRIASLDRDFGRAREIVELLPEEFWKE